MKTPAISSREKLSPQTAAEPHTAGPNLVPLPGSRVNLASLQQLLFTKWRAPAPSRFQTSISFCPPGQCPRNRVRCEIQERDLCMNSRDCPKKMKCCLFNCGKKCLDINKDVCTLPKVPGPCNAFFVRWWYDQEKETCSSFIYGGCQGNNNNFQSEGVCHAICPRRRSVSWLG
uniref:BPTI/Kunitz inhibitor domain-containing protein n=1 Tax=Moschus moschiferus TaxID=68415 RepID=A0A8C6CSG7_MOSMO